QVRPKSSLSRPRTSPFLVMPPIPTMTRSRCSGPQRVAQPLSVFPHLGRLPRLSVLQRLAPTRFNWQPATVPPPSPAVQQLRSTPHQARPHSMWIRLLPAPEAGQQPHPGSRLKMVIPTRPRNGTPSTALLPQTTLLSTSQRGRRVQIQRKKFKVRPVPVV